MSQIRIGDVANWQLVMAAARRNAAGTTSSPNVRSRLWQNHAGLWESISQSNKLVSTAITATQFIRSTGLTTNG